MQYITYIYLFTFDVWLERIVIWENYVIQLNQKSKEKLIERARFPYQKDKYFCDDLPVDQGTIKAHESGRLDALGLETAVELYRITQEPPLMPIEKSDDEDEIGREMFEKGTTTKNGVERVKLDPDFQRMIFAPYRNNREYLARITGEEKINLRRYSNLDRKTIPKDTYETLIEDLQREINFEPVVSGDLRLQNTYELIQENLDIGEFFESVDQPLRNLKNMEEFDSEIAYKAALLENYEDVLTNITFNKNSGNETVITNNIHNNLAHRALEDLGFLSKSGSNVYNVETNLFGLERAEKILDNTYYSGIDSTEEEIFKTVIDHVKSSGNKSPDHFNQNSDLPIYTIFDSDEFFGDWAELLWRAGMKPNKEFNESPDRDMVIEEFSELAFETGEVPSMNSFLEETEILSRRTFYNYFDGFEDLLESSALKTRKEVQNSEIEEEAYRAVNEHLEEGGSLSRSETDD